MTEEEKAKAYDEVIETCKRGFNFNNLSCTHCEIKKKLEQIFPELAENEDERIRNEILLYIGSKQDINLDTHNRWCTYLENRKKQKPTELPKSEDYGVDGLYAAVDILQKTLGEVDGYQTDDGILEHKCAISAVKELYEQQPAEWSEEDEKRFDSCMGRLLTPDGAPTINSSWFEDHCSKHPHWKPSEAQMIALTLAIEGKCPPTSYMSRRLEDLYEDLANEYNVE